jgi:hypothetical protein
MIAFNSFYDLLYKHVCFTYTLLTLHYEARVNELLHSGIITIYKYSENYNF